MKETVVIIDSGVDKPYANIIGGVSLSMNVNGSVIFSDTVADNIGHGTAIYHLINDACKNIDFFVVKIFDASYKANQTLLLHALQYIYDNVHCKFIVISSGSVVCLNKKAISAIIDKLYYEKGIFIISAFNNEGALSFPSSHTNVIGVDSSEFVSTAEKYYIVSGSDVDILSSRKTHRLKWLNGKKNIAAGNSFIAPEFASMMINAYQQLGGTITDKAVLLKSICYENNHIVFDDVGEHDKSKARLTPEYVLGDTEKKLKAVTFPFSKEVRSLAANEDLLQIDIVQYCDIKQSGKTGLKVAQLLGYSANNKKIEDINKIDWNSDFDMVVLGHCDMLKAASGEDWFETILCLAKKHNKYVFAFDPVENEYEKLFSPPLIASYSSKTFAKLRQVDTPVLGIFGTSSQQGKFSLQLNMRRRFLQDGYAVGQITTEPMGYLFGMDYTYPTGYNRSIGLSQEPMAMFVNELMYDCSLKEPNIILVGGQAHIVPPMWVHANNYGFRQYEFMTGTLPDAVLLVVNTFDSVRYIKRSIAFIEAAADCQVVACVVSPTPHNHPAKFNSVDELAGQISKPVLAFSDVESIYSSVIEFFGGKR